MGKPPRSEEQQTHPKGDTHVPNENLHKLSEDETNELALEAGEQVEETEFLLERFSLNEDYDVIDKLNPTGPKGSYHPEVDSRKDQRYLRELVLWRRLCPLVENLIMNLQPERIDHAGNKYQPDDEEGSSIWSVIHAAICASSLNTLEPSVSIRNRFDGTLRRQKKSLQEVTSLSLFRDDVELLLRDLYGDSNLLDIVLNAVFRIVREFARWVRPDREHQDACNWDYIHGIGVPEGHGIHGHDHGIAYAALDDLRHVFARCVKNRPPSANIPAEFATRHVEHFIRLDAPRSRVDAQTLAGLRLVGQAIGASVEIEESEGGTKVGLR